MLSKGLQVMWPDEPFALVFLRESTLYIFKVVVGWQVQGVARGNIVIDQGVVLDDAEFLSWVEGGT